jgi:DNA-binding transcriptional LysR family regulator
MTISLNRLDLNLLRVFDAVMEERSVLRASERVFLSQSAVSHSLARLREVLNDELFIRSPTGMQPTSRALTMAPLIREAWKSLQAAIELPKFESHSLTRRFTIAVSDFITMVMAPRLLELLRQDAPLVDFVIRADTRMEWRRHGPADSSRQFHSQQHAQWNDLRSAHTFGRGGLGRRRVCRFHEPAAKGPS